MELEKKYSMAKLALVVLCVVCVALGASLVRDRGSSGKNALWSGSDPAKSFEAFSESFSRQFQQGHDRSREMLDKFFDDGFFRDNKDPFEAMEKMRKELLGRMEKGVRESFDSSWDDWHGSRFSGGGSLSLDMEETGHSYIYRIAIPNREGRNLKVDVSEGGIRIEGKLERKREKKDSGGSVVARQEAQSSVSQHFSLPLNADYAKAEITNGEDEIVIKIPKK